MANYSMVSSSLNTQYSGSIHKLLAIGQNNIANLSGSIEGQYSTLLRVEWGNYSYPDSSFTATAITECRGCDEGVDPITVPAGTYIEGPIGRLKTGNVGGWIIYTSVA
jgi:hypothetical protein